MAKDNSNKSKRDNKKNNVKRNDNNSDSNHSDSDSNSDNSSRSSNDGDMDVNEFRKYLQKIFPSKHMDQKVKALEKLNKSNKKEKENNSPKKSNKYLDDNDIWGTDSDDEEEPKKSAKKSNKKHLKKGRRNVNDENDDDTSTINDSDTYHDSDDDYIDDEDNKYKKGKLNITLTIGSDNDEWTEYEEDNDEYDEDYEEENEDEEVSTDESEEELDDNSEEVSEEDSNTSKKNRKRNNKNNTPNSKENKSNKKNKYDVTSDDVNYDKINENDSETLKSLKELLQKFPDDLSIKKCIQSYEENVKLENKKKEKKQKKQKDKNLRIFKKMLIDKDLMDDITFYKKLEIEHQKKLIKEVREINKIATSEKPYRLSLLESDIPIKFKAEAFKKLNALKNMDDRNNEYCKLKQWADTFMKIPFSNYKSIPISIDDGVDKCHDFMENAQKILNNAVYGLDDAKMQIMQILGQFISNPKSVGTAIAIHGPPGTGKTSLVKEGISKILNRPFEFIALGGATDSSVLEGHSYTYEGSKWGKIVQILIDSECMNPIIYFDELDKISDTPKGEEIAGILTHLTDTSQNSEFHDKYFSEFSFDLSKCLFIFSYNDETKVNPILKDRMYKIKTKGYSNKEKIVIVNNYLLPKIRDQVRFNEQDIIIPDDVIGYINETHCNKEDGVRNMKRCLEIIHTKLNLYRLMKPGSNLFESEMSLKVEFPFKVTKDIVDKLIKKESQNMSALYSMYV